MTSIRLSFPPRPSESLRAFLRRRSFEPERHNLFEDALAIVSGSALAGLGIMLFDKAHLTVGGTAGLALLVHFISGYDFWPIFIVLGLPFFWLGANRMGADFALRTAMSISLTCAFTVLFSSRIHVAWIDAGTASLLGGLLTGTGLLALFRHRTGLGGLNIFALYLQETRGIRAGLIQIGVDAAIFLAAAFVLSPTHLALSLLGSVATNSVLVINHRTGRYVGTTSGLAPSRRAAEGRAMTSFDGAHQRSR